MNKATKGKNMLIKAIDNMIGEDYCGLFIAVLADTLKNTADKCGGRIDIRSIEIKINDFFALKYDCKTDKYIKTNL